MSGVEDETPRRGRILAPDDPQLRNARPAFSEAPAASMPAPTPGAEIENARAGTDVAAQEDPAAPCAVSEDDAAGTPAVMEAGATPCPGPADGCPLEVLVPEDALAAVLEGSLAASLWERHREILAPVADAASPAFALRGGDRLGDPRVLQFPEPREAPSAIWVIGDLHGDLLALEAARWYLEKSLAPGDAAVFLGDLADDGPHGPDTVLRVLDLLGRPGSPFALIAGNHDLALAFDGATSAFTSGVDPGDLAEILNRRGPSSPQGEVGRDFVALAGRLPRAVFLPDGTLLVHGGVPHQDQLPALREPRDLLRPECLDDFAWGRLHARARRRRPFRSNRSVELGREDVEAFCAAATSAGLPVRRIVRGHDHVPERFAWYEAYVRCPVLTINAMCRRLAREWSGPQARRPALARWTCNGPLEVHRLLIPEHAVKEFHG